MKKRGAALFLFLVILPVFLFFMNQKSNASQSPSREVKIIDQRVFEEEGLGGQSLVVFGDKKSELYQDLITFLKAEHYPYTEYLISDVDFLEKLKDYKEKAGFSEGMSNKFRYYPLIFVREKAFSGFNAQIKEQIKEEIIWEDQKKEEDQEKKS